MSVAALAPGMFWASIELMKHQTIGHEVDSLCQFFASLTAQDSSALSLAINGANSGHHKSADDLKASQGFACDRQDLGADSEFWDMETGTASFRTTFDPISRRRRDIIANARHAFMYGVHPEEFQARCASRDLPSPFAEEDAVALFIYATVRQQFRSEATAERYMRVYLGGRRCGTAALFCARTLVAADALGRIYEVRMLQRAARGCRARKRQHRPLPTPYSCSSRQGDAPASPSPARCP